MGFFMVLHRDYQTGNIGYILNLSSDVRWNRRNMIILVVALALGLGIQLVPDSMNICALKLR